MTGHESAEFISQLALYRANNFSQDYRRDTH